MKNKELGILRVHCINHFRIKHKVCFLVILWLIVSTHSDQYFIWSFSVLLLLILLLINNGKLYYFKMPGILTICGTIAVGFIVGSVALCNGVATCWPFVRDGIRATIYPIFWLVTSSLLHGYAVNDRDICYQTIFCFCGISSLIDFILFFPSRVEALGLGFSAFVDVYSPEKYMTAVGFFLSVFNPWNDKRKYYISKKIDLLFKCAIIMNLALSFSRTAFLIALCIMVPFLGKYLSTFLKVAVILLLTVIVLNIFIPDVTAYFLYKILNSLQEISGNKLWSETQIVQNWRGYEIYRMQEYFKDSTLFHQFFGYGYGSYIDVGSYASLVTSEAQLPYFHNGYYTMLLKGGVVGVALNLGYYFLNGLLLFKQKRKSFDRSFLLGLLISMVVATWVVGGVFWGYLVPVYTTIMCWLPKCDIKFAKENISRS